jgi:hypothetical protein
VDAAARRAVGDSGKRLNTIITSFPYFTRWLRFGHLL